MEWTSKDTKVASVSQTGLVKAKGIYMTTITASYAWERVKCRIYVHNPSLKLSKSSLSLKVGETKSLKATVKGVSNEVTWQLSAPTVATVSGNGVITAVGVGKTTISATANGKTKKCTVKVKDNTPKPYL